MDPLTEQQIRAAFVNASKREVNQAVLPDLDAVDWESLDYLGWQDAKRPKVGYVVLDPGSGPVAVRLTSAAPGARGRKAVCAWCADVVRTGDVSMYVARRGGSRGRKGDTIGTLICTDFGCSANVRRRPTVSEVGSDDPADHENFVARRIAGLQERSARFIAQVVRTDD